MCLLFVFLIHAILYFRTLDKQMNFLFASLFAVFTAAIASQGNTTD